MNMKINVGIVGYGNLGKSAEKSILANKKLNLVAIFSRRLVRSTYCTKVEAYENFKDYIGKIDVMLLCGGSKSDLEIQTPEMAKYFDVINTFDTHKKIPTEFDKLNKIAKNSGHRVIMSCGWDPGIFSVMRAMFMAIGKNDSTTFWGKGISMGHSDAIRRVNGVKDAVQFTVPNPDAIKLAKAGKLPDDMPRHFRECYVVCDQKDQARIECEIKDIPNYFSGQPTTVNFVSPEQLMKLKSKMLHRGEVISSFKTAQGTKCKMNFSLYMDSNPDFTASVMISYINAVINLKENNQTGAFTNLDIPTSYLFVGKEKENLIKTLC